MAEHTTEYGSAACRSRLTATRSAPKPFLELALAAFCLRLVQGGIERAEKSVQAHGLWLAARIKHQANCSLTFRPHKLPKSTVLPPALVSLTLQDTRTAAEFKLPPNGRQASLHHCGVQLGVSCLRRIDARQTQSTHASHASTGV